MHGSEMWMGGPGGPGFGFFPFWPLLMILFWFGVWRLFSGGHRRRHWQHERRFDAPAPPQDPALNTLRERFARGEIDRAEYEERRAILLERQAAPAAPARSDIGKTKDGSGQPGGPDAGSGQKRGEHGQEWPDLV